MATRGFTLLEMLVVLALLGLTLSFSLPRVESIYSGVQLSIGQEELEHAIGRIPDLARRTGQAFSITQWDEEIARRTDVSVPDGWTLEIKEPWEISALGFCSSGSFDLNDGRSSRKFKLTSPYCNVDETDEHLL